MATWRPSDQYLWELLAESRTNRCASRWLRSWQSYESSMAKALGISHATYDNYVKGTMLHLCIKIHQNTSNTLSKLIKTRIATRCHLRAPHPYLSVKVRTINLGWQLKCNVSPKPVGPVAERKTSSIFAWCLQTGRRISEALPCQKKQVFELKISTVLETVSGHTPSIHIPCQPSCLVLGGLR